MHCQTEKNTIRKTQIGKIIIFIVLTFGFFVFLWSKETTSEILDQCQLLPEELLLYANKRGYRQVTDFYKNRPGMLNPPYVYGVLTGHKEDSAAFWCERTVNNRIKYFLIIMITNEPNQDVCKCKNIIEWHNYPGGLSVFDDPNTSLDEFYYIDNPKKNLESGNFMKGRGILSEYDGVETLFFCYNGKWIVRMRH